MSVELDLKTVAVSIDDIKPYDKNPRKGNVNAIAESLDKNGQYRPIVVQQSTGMILAGNHTWLGAKSLGWEEISVVYIDVDDAAAKRIVIADNRTADLGSYDPELLAEILAALPDTEGTGYTEQDKSFLVDSILANEESNGIQIDQLIRPSQVTIRTDDEVKTQERQAEATSGGVVGGISRPDLTTEDEGLAKFEDFSSELSGVLHLREDVFFSGDNPWGIPSLRDDMLVTDDDIPNLETWVSAKITGDDPESSYLFNYNLGSSVGIPYDRTVLGFYTHDEKFEGWWSLPANYTTKALNAGLRFAMTPDFSVQGPLLPELDGADGWPPVINMLNLYRSCWLARFFQEAGIKIIPNMRWINPEQNEQYVKYALYKNAPVAITQIQTFDNKNPMEVEYHEEGLAWAIEYATPEILYVYTGEPGAELAKRVVERTKHKPEIRILWSYSKIKNDERKKREAEREMTGESGLFTGDSKLTSERLEEVKASQGTFDSMARQTGPTGERDDDWEDME